MACQREVEAEVEAGRNGIRSLVSASLIFSWPLLFKLELKCCSRKFFTSEVPWRSQRLCLCRGQSLRTSFEDCSYVKYIVPFKFFDKYSSWKVIQYYIHRFVLHENSNVLSRLHNSWFHSVTAPYSFVAHYDHPASYIFFRFLPTYLPSIIFRVHLLTYLLLLAIITLEETFTLSGYATMPGIMLGGITRRQDLHSRGGGKGNFAPWGLLDWIHGTSIGADVVSHKSSVSNRFWNILPSMFKSSWNIPVQRSKLNPIIGRSTTWRMRLRSTMWKNGVEMRWRMRNRVVKKA